MKRKFFKIVLGSTLSCLLAMGAITGSAFGLDIDLVAEEASVTMPDATVVTMWGLRNINDPTHAAGEWKVPVFKTTDTILNITFSNNLPADTANLEKPTSLIIPGLQAIGAGAMVPTWTDGTSGNRFADPDTPQAIELEKRVRSLTYETVNGVGSPTYSWNLQPGTYLIQSGTHQALQVQMGLYAVLVVNAAENQAYGVDSTFTNEQVLVYSEIDSALHAAVAADAYGPGMTYSSTMNFNPDYYLINGQPYSDGAPPVILGGSAGNVLLRFVNAGYETRVPVMQGDYFSLIAEDGHLLPYPQEVYSVELTAGKTKDALWSNPQPGITNLYDARFNLTNAGVGGGGLLTKLATGEEGALLVPNGGETWTRGMTYTVSWVPNPSADNYNLFYFDANGAPYLIANVPDNTGSYDWTVPLNATAESGKKLRVTAFAGTTRLAVDWTDGTFTIIPHMYPNGGETLTEGLAYHLTWASVADADNYNLFYFDLDNTPHLISTVGNVTSYNWTVPFNAIAGAGKRLRVTPFNGVTRIGSGVQWSDGAFTIASQLFPNGGETLFINNAYDLTWAPVAGADTYNLFYFDTDNLPHYIDTVGNVSTYNWTVPVDATVGSNNRFRVTPFAGTTRMDAAVQWSDTTFTIAP